MTERNRKPHQLLIVCAVFVCFFVTLSAVRAQEDQSETASSTSPRASTTPTVSDRDTNPYEVRALPGDEVVGDFVLGPGKVELEIAPGESRTVTLTVANRIGEPHVFNIDVEDMTTSGDTDGSVKLLGNDTGPYTLKDYISIPDYEFTLDHSREAVIPVTVSIPADAEPGGHYGSVLVKTVTQKATKSEGTTPAGSAIVSRIGTLFFVRVPGDIDYAGELKSFETVPDAGFFAEGPIDFAIVYENTGSVHTNPYGELRITNMFDEEVGFVEIEPWFVLPGAVRLRELTWDRDLLYGRYEATLKLNRGYDDVVDEQTVVFWVIPWKIVLMGFAVLFVVFYIIRTFFRTFEFKRR